MLLCRSLKVYQDKWNRDAISNKKITTSIEVNELGAELLRSLVRGRSGCINWNEDAEDGSALL